MADWDNLNDAMIKEYYSRQQEIKYPIAYPYKIEKDAINFLKVCMNQQNKYISFGEPPQVRENLVCLHYKILLAYQLYQQP